MKTRYHIMQRLARLSEEMAERAKELSELDTLVSQSEDELLREVAQHAIELNMAMSELDGRTRAAARVTPKEPEAPQPKAANKPRQPKRADSKPAAKRPVAPKLPSNYRGVTFTVPGGEADSIKMGVAVPTRNTSSVFLSAHELTLNVGSYATREEAARDAKEMLSSSRIFWDRITEFPDPRKYAVQPRVEGAKVVKRANPKFKPDVYTVSLTVTTLGDDKKTLAWHKGVVAKNKAEQE